MRYPPIYRALSDYCDVTSGTRPLTRESCLHSEVRQPNSAIRGSVSGVVGTGFTKDRWDAQLQSSQNTIQRGAAVYLAIPSLSYIEMAYYNCTW